MARTLDSTKKTAILTAAKSILMQDGYTAAKMSDIAAEAGVASGTLYLYFENKEALASAIGEEFFSRLITQFGSIIKKIEDPDSIIALVDWAAQIAYQDQAVLAMAKERNQDLKSKNEGRQRLITKLAEALSEVMSKGVIRQYSDTTILAELVFALMRRIIMSYALFQDENIDELKAGTVVLIQHALFDDITLTASQLVKRQQHRSRQTKKNDRITAG